MHDARTLILSGTVPFDRLDGDTTPMILDLVSNRPQGVSHEDALAIVMATMNAYGLFDEGCLLPIDDVPVAEDVKDAAAPSASQAAALAALGPIHAVDWSDGPAKTRDATDDDHAPSVAPAEADVVGIGRHAAPIAEEYDRAVADAIVATLDDGVSTRARVGRLCRGFGVAKTLDVQGSPEGRLVAAIEARLGVDPDVRHAATLGERITALETLLPAAEADRTVALVIQAGSEQDRYDRETADGIVATLDEGDSTRARVGRLCRRHGISKPIATHGSVEGRLVAAMEARLGVDPDLRHVTTLGARIAALEALA